MLKRSFAGKIRAYEILLLFFLSFRQVEDLNEVYFWRANYEAETGHNRCKCVGVWSTRPFIGTK